MKIRDRSTLSLFDSRHSNADRAPTRVWIDPDEPDGDSFAGGGGARLGIKNAYIRLGLERRARGIAVNHWPEALAMYAANHPECDVHCEDVHDVDPVKAGGGKRYVIAWFSPTCIFFSQARGGALDADEATKVRGLAWVADDWAKSDARPRVLCLENVKQFEQWGPLHRQHSNGCSDEIALGRGTHTRKGKITPKCLKGCCYGRPIKARKGEFFRQFVDELRKSYRHVSWRVLKAHHYGAPTSRERFFLIASDNPVTWPEPTHGPGRIPYRTAADCIDWSIPCPSIFERATPLKPKTCARIVAGVHRFVFGAARPFIVPAQYGDKDGTDVRINSVDEPARTICGKRGGHAVVEPLVMKAKTYSGGGNDAQPASVPLSTITTSKRGEHAIAVPFLIHRSNGERGATETSAAQAPRIYDIQKSLTTIVAGGIKHGLAVPVLIKNNGGNNDRCGSAGQDVEKPLDTIATRDQKSIAMFHLLKLRGTSEAHVNASSLSIDGQVPTISTGGERGGIHLAQVAAFLVRYNGQRDREARGQRLDAPISTLDTANRFSVVTLTMSKEICERAMRVAKFLGYDKPILLEIDSDQWILVDIGFRMLTPPELFRCQGFPPDYKIDVLFNGKPLTKTAQTKCVGNSVPPQLAEAVAIAAIQTVEYEPQYARAA